MGGLPNGHNAVIPEGKVRNYLLNHQHDEGGPKAAFLAEFDYGPDEWREFTKAIQLHAIEADAMQIAETGYGVSRTAPNTRRTQSNRYLHLAIRYWERSAQIDYTYPTGQRMIQELDLVETTVPVDDGRIPAGAAGTVVAVYANGQGYEVEFTARGVPALQTSRVITLDAAFVRKTEPSRPSIPFFIRPTPVAQATVAISYKSRSDTVLIEFSDGPGDRWSDDNVVWYRIDRATHTLRSISIVGFLSTWLPDHPDLVNTLIGSMKANASIDSLLQQLLPQAA